MHYRALRAATGLEKWEEAMGHAEAGLRLDPTNADILRMKATAEEKLTKKEEQERRRVAEMLAIRGPAVTLAATIQRCAGGLRGRVIAT